MSKRIISFMMAICMIVATSCSKESKKVDVMDQSKVTKIEKTNEASDELNDDSRLYEMEKRDSVDTFYVTIAEDNATSFYELDKWYSIHDSTTDAPKLDIIIQEGTEKGIKKGALGSNEINPNASIELRGKSTRVAAQKSFKINFYDSAGLWKGQKTLNLNKHPYDATRIRNKLSFDYFTLIPHLTSLRTQFVHLYIRDLTDKNSKGKFVDYGLYTHIEQANERFLASHGLDSNGNLYKATNFEFYRYPNQLKLETNPSFKKSEFEKILEIKGSKDHEKLLKMLDDVNDYSQNINDVVNKHFNKENYLTWIATSILMGNQDVITQNFYLYSPVNSKKWYFLPWDYDGGWSTSLKVEAREELPDWQKGLSNYWGAVLHKRFFRDPNNVEALSQKIEELSRIITKKQTKKFLDEYYPVVSKFVKKSPDKDHLDIKVSDYEKAFYDFLDESDENKKIYYQNIEFPMPFFLNEIEKENGYEFEWDASYDIQGDDLSYTFQISKDPSFSNMIVQKKGLTNTTISINKLAKGSYYWRVIASDTKGHKRLAFDIYEDAEGTKYFGVKNFVVR